MPHDISLISTIAVGLGFAFVGGIIAFRLGVPPLVGYLIAGIAIGPFTPDFVADVELAPQLAEIGVILLMFALVIVLLRRRPLSTALTVAAALAPIGEFSFILADLGNRMKVIPDEGMNRIVAGAIFSIALNPYSW